MLPRKSFARRIGIHMRKILGIMLLVLVLLLAGGITFTIGWRPFFGPRMRATTNRTFDRTPERAARGKYLFEAAAGCVDCHSPHDWSQPGAPVSPAHFGIGAPALPSDLPGKVFAPNLTPDPETGLGRWTDDEIARAIREGVDRDGRALFPFMPYPHYRRMSDEDVASVVVYLRELPPVHNAVPQTEMDFPVKYLMRSDPEPITAPVPPPDTSTPVSRGAYLVEIASCSDCHTPQHRGTPVPGMDFAGGFILKGNWGTVASANITPDPTGISYYDENLFRDVMRTGFVHARKLNIIMPWQTYGGMTDQDLSDMFAYLKTLKPVAHRVDNTEPPTYCKKCGFVHGLGDKN